MLHSVFVIIFVSYFITVHHFGTKSTLLPPGHVTWKCRKFLPPTYVSSCAQSLKCYSLCICAIYRCEINAFFDVTNIAVNDKPIKTLELHRYSI